MILPWSALPVSPILGRIKCEVSSRLQRLSNEGHSVMLAVKFHGDCVKATNLILYIIGM